MSVAGFHPLVRQWFTSQFPSPTAIQSEGWNRIRAGGDVLLCAPTGSGKTLAAFLHCIDRLVAASASGQLPATTQVIYVSPLKALSNDIHRNLDVPLSGIQALANMEPIRAALRTGDTTATERGHMRKAPPHILVTTPESLFILLTTESFRKALSGVRTVIVDEIHAVAGDKRGSHLALTLARLDALVTGAGNPRPQHIGLSATVRPVEEIARFLGPSTAIVRTAGRRDLTLAVEVPRDELSSVASMEMWAEIYDRLAELILAHRTTLIFVSTRRLSERVAHHLTGRLGPNLVLPHHGSLARHLRLDAEQRLKAGELRAVVATASLELGIDIGAVDLVCQIGSARSISAAIQRIGRSGHQVGARPHGRFFATTRDELIECAATVRAIREGELDRFNKPRAPLDILAQQLVAACACDDWNEDALYQLARSAWSYEGLTRESFNQVVAMLSDGINTARGRNGAWLHHDQVNHRVRARRGGRLAAITSGGAIPDTTQYTVVSEPDGATVGTLDEDFAIESLAGDVFLLGATSWRIRRVEAGRVRVEDAHGAAPSMPFWNGEAPGRTFELSEHTAALRHRILEAGPAASERLIEECGLCPRGAAQAAEYVHAGAAALGGLLPSLDTVVAERFFDEAGGQQLILHAPFGARVNRAWGLALRKRFCRSFNVELQAAATDNGIVISLTEQHSFPLDIIFEFLKPGNLEYTLRQALLASPMFGVRWRWNATRALTILRFAGGRRVPPAWQRMKADDLVAAVFPDQAACAENLTGEINIPDHPLVQETISNCLHEAMDFDRLALVVAAINSGAIRTAAIETSHASPFCHEIINANPFAFLDDAPLEERRTRAVQLRRTLRVELPDAPGALNPEAIRTVRQEAWPDPRDPDELHDALTTLVAAPPEPAWQAWFDELAATGRGTCYRGLWVTTERAGLARDVYERHDAAAAAQLLAGWMESTGPASITALAGRLTLTEALTGQAMAILEAQGQVLQGSFTPGAQGVEWCSRRLLARIHRLTIGQLRHEIEPVSTEAFLRFLHHWQHLAPGRQLHGADGLLEVIRQLEGYEAPAAAWEQHILPRRVAGYEPGLLDSLCLSGEVMWARLSPARATESAPLRRVRPTRIAPLAIFPREDGALLYAAPARCGGTPPALSDTAADVLAALERSGASFFADIQRGAGRLASEVEDGLWELAAAGLVTADGFENIRSLIDEKRRRGEGRQRTARPRHAAGRWALTAMHAEPAADWTEQFARLLLRRWGVLCRDLLAREPLAPGWRDLLVVLRRMEMRGEVRGGRFIASVAGEHFAMPEALDLLRALRRARAEDLLQPAAPADPLNLAGIILPGARISPLAAAIPMPHAAPLTLSFD
ncbi:MAG: DEAD/DEAH box helicase [Acidobacteria bacterium]|nr:DEAD/DEAH box helicase [Acidobacteriota bacterium]